MCGQGAIEHVCKDRGNFTYHIYNMRCSPCSHVWLDDLPCPGCRLTFSTLDEAKKVDEGARVFDGCDKGVGEEHDTSFLHNSCGSLIGVAVAESSLLKKWYKSQYFAFSWVHLFFARKSLDLLESYLLCNIFKVYLCMTLSMHLFTIIHLINHFGV